ncbi:hypothetical protein ACOMHN_008124 [Nucella lapillus]
MSGRKGRSRDHPNVLAALMPGSQITDPSRRILINTAPVNEIVKFNIGGTIFETYWSTLHKLPGSPLADEAFLQKHFQKDRKQYFFDRDPDVFGAILNYLRTGELHLPTKYCGPAVKTEMEFWGIEEDEIEECCWTSYSSWTTMLQALRKLERDRKVHLAGCSEEAEMTSPGSKLYQLRVKGWALLNNPRSSIAAQIYSYISLAFVVVSIFSFVAQTHEFFRVPVNTTAGTSAPGTETISGTDNGSVPYTVPTTNTSIGDNQAGNTEEEVHPALTYIDAVGLAFFLLEFISRLVLAPRRAKLLLMPMTIMEMLALLPDLIEFSVLLFFPEHRNVTAVDVITFLRLLRVFRIFRLMRHFPGLWILFYTLKASVKELLLLMMFLCVGMLFFASLIYYTDDREVFPSIPSACWWSIITMTTVGYGDVSPTTGWGYVVGSMTAVCGVLVIGFTVPVLVNNFILYYQHTQSALNREADRTQRGFRRVATAPVTTPTTPTTTSEVGGVALKDLGFSASSKDVEVTNNGPNNPRHTNDV